MEEDEPQDTHLQPAGLGPREVARDEYRLFGLPPVLESTIGRFTYSQPRPRRRRLVVPRRETSV